YRAFALQIRPETSADVGAFVPIEAKPVESVTNRRHCFLDVACLVGVFDAQNEFAAVMPGKKPVEKRSARSANVQITGGRGGKTDADFGSHAIVILSESEGSRKSSMQL